MKEWLASTLTQIELICTVNCINLAEVKSYEAAYIAQIPPEKSKNTQGKRKADLDWGDKCELAVPQPTSKQRSLPRSLTMSNARRISYSDRSTAPTSHSTSRIAKLAWKRPWPMRKLMCSNYCNR